MRRDLQQLVAQLEAEQLQYVDARVKEAETVALAIEPVVSAGFKPRYRGTMVLQYPIFKVTEADLPTIAKITGHFDPDQTSIEPKGDGRSRKVTFTVRPADEKFSKLRFEYDGLLPKAAKCKVKTEWVKQTAVVCER